MSSPSSRHARLPPPLTDADAIAAVIEAVRTRPELREMLRVATSNVTVVYNGSITIELVPAHLQPFTTTTTTAAGGVDYCPICLDDNNNNNGGSDADNNNWATLKG